MSNESRDSISVIDYMREMKKDLREDNAQTHKRLALLNGKVARNSTAIAWLKGSMAATGTGVIALVVRWLAGG